MRGLFVVALLMCATPYAQAQAPPPEQQTAPIVSPESHALEVLSGTLIRVRTVSALGSQTNHRGDVFELELAEPLVVDGIEVAPIGARGLGEVLDAGRSGWGGRPGKLILAARSLEVRGRQVRIRSLQLISNGENRSNSALAASVVMGAAAPIGGFAGFLVTGGEIQIPEGTLASARIGETVEIDDINAADSQPQAPEVAQSAH